MFSILKTMFCRFCTKDSSIRHLRSTLSEEGPQNLCRLPEDYFMEFYENFINEKEKKTFILTFP